MSTTINGITYTVYTVSGSATARVSRHTSDILADSVIESSVTIGGTNYDVTSIGSTAFSYSSLNSITIPNSVLHIELQAFYMCTNLTSVTMFNSVVLIFNYAFEMCNSLISITIPSSVTSIGNSAFSGCTSLIDVFIENPSLITTVYANSFTNVSTNIDSIITFNNTASYSDLSATWQTISAYYYSQTYIDPTIPIIISDSSELQDFMDSTSITGYITNSMTIDFTLAGSCSKTLIIEDTAIQITM